MTDFHYPVALTGDLTRSCRVVATRDELAMQLPRWRTVAQVGAGLGEPTELILSVCSPPKVTVVDPFTLHNEAEFWRSHLSGDEANLDHENYFRDRFSGPISEGRLELFRGEEFEAIEWLTDGSVGTAWVQGRTSYRDVRDHLQSLLPKMNDDGVIVVANYIMSDYLAKSDYGVIQATNEFMVQNRWEMVALALPSSMFCDVAIRRVR
jgi:hypothetical protein